MIILCFIKSIVEINSEKYILWHRADEYQVHESIHATPLKDWEKLMTEFEDMDDIYCEFEGIFIYDYNKLKESLIEYLEEEK